MQLGPLRATRVRAEVSVTLAAFSHYLKLSNS